MDTGDQDTSGDIDMVECDGEKIVTMVDVLQEQEEFEQDANAVLGASDDTNCTYKKGYVKRQALYACMTCCPEAKDNPSKRAGICLACSLSCHENHDLIELYTKRNFRCDCGNPKFNHPCNFIQDKIDFNENNSYNQNFSGLYCTCQRPYPDPDNDIQDEMIQCIICEDWLHVAHLEASVPGNDQYGEMICKGCMENNQFLHDYNDLAVNVEHDIDILNISSENLYTKINEINIPSCSETEDVIKESNIKIAETANETNIEKSITASESNEKNDPTENENLKLNEENKIITEFNTSEKQNIVNNIASSSMEEKDVNGSKHESEIKTNENNLDSQDCDVESKEKSVDSDTMEEDQSSTDPSLEDNIKALTDLINETDDQPEETNSNSSADIDDKPSEKLSTLEDTTITEDINPSVNTNADKTEDTENVEKEQIEIDQDEATNTNHINNDEAVDDTISEDQKIVGDIKESRQDQLPENEVEKEPEDKLTTNKVPEQKSPENNEPNEKADSQDNDINYQTNGSSEKEPKMEIDQISNDNESLKDVNEKPPENKRKSPTDVVEEEKCNKKVKVDEENPCMRPKGVKVILKGATFWPSNFRQKLCTCTECLSMYKDLSLLFLIDVEDTVTFYENLGKEKIRIEGTPQTQYEKGLEALSSLNRVQQINALTEYNKLKERLSDFFKSFKEKKKVVKEEDIKAFFAGMKPKREPDGVYFCR